MAILDRYLVQLYLKVLFVSFFSLAGLFVIIDGFQNIDEFLSYGKQHSLGTGGVVFDYYWPRLLWLFNYLAGLMAMIAATFALTWLQRTNELTAIFAAGISPARVVRPLLGASLAVALAGAANREFALPQIREMLSRNAQDWLGEASRKCTPRYDIRSEILIGGRSTRAAQKEIIEPLFRLPPELASWGRQIAADSAFYQTATPQHPAGYLLRGVRQPVNLQSLASQSLENRPVLFSPADANWLKPDECFVVSVVTFERLTAGTLWRQFLSSYELVTGLRGQTIEPGADIRLTLHSRLVQPLLDMSLVMLGIPLVLTGASRNIFLGGLLGGGLVAGMILTTLACQALGANYLLPSTSLAAWLPLLIFGPFAYISIRRLWD